MNKFFTSLVMLAAGCFFVLQSKAQVPQPRSANDEGNGRIRENLGNPRLFVNSPASVAGLKKITIASWGNQGNPPVLNMPVVKGLDTLAASPLTNGSSISGKVCMLYRGGGITFAQKAQYAANAGAIAVIIVNNVSGDPAGMANTGSAILSIPIVMVSDVDGNAINSVLSAGGTVRVSIGGWGLAPGHDLSIVPAYQSLPHALNIPYSQLSVGAGRMPYANYPGGAIANKGVFTESGVTVMDTVKWNPSSGSATTVHTGSYSVPTIAPADSVMFGFAAPNSSWSLSAPSELGYYSYKYDISYGNSDTLPNDNTYTYNQYVTDSIFCKGTYDYTNGRPHITLSVQPGVTTPITFCFGPLYYMARGKYYARDMQYYVASNNPTLSGEESYALLFKWSDGSNTQPLDSFVQGDELKLVGLGRKAYGPNDSNQYTTVNLLTTNNKPVILDSNAWYWTAVQVTTTCFLGVDGDASYFTRSYVQSRQYANRDMPELLFTNVYTSLSGSSDTLTPYPFTGANGIQNVNEAFYERMNSIPNIAFRISKNQAGVGVENVATNDVGSMKIYPNPADKVITAELKLRGNANKVEYRLLGLNGHVVYKLNKANVLNDVVTIPSQNIAAGIYYLAAFTEAGHVVERVVVQH